MENEHSPLDAILDDLGVRSMILRRAGGAWTAAAATDERTCSASGATAKEAILAAVSGLVIATGKRA